MNENGKEARFERYHTYEAPFKDRNINRKIMRLQATVEGLTNARADQITDLVEQIDEIRQNQQRLEERVERIAQYLNSQKSGTNGHDNQNSD